MSKKANIRLMAIVIIAVLSCAGWVWADLMDGMVAYWELDEGSGSIVKDLAGSNDGTIYGSVSWTAVDIGKALGFPGTSGSFVNCGNGSSINNLTNFSVSLWFKTNFLPSGTRYPLMIGQAPSSSVTWGLNLHGDYGARVHARVRSGTSTSDDAYSTANFTPQIGTWYHYVITYDDTTDRLIRIYINGQETSYFNRTPAKGTKFSNPLLPVTLGNSSDGGSMRAWNGSLDEVKIFNRVLSAEEVLQLYNGQLEGVEIAGPEKVAEGFSARYKALAHYDNGSIKDVTNLASWFVEPNTNAGINNTGFLTAGPVEVPQDVVVGAEYTEDQITQQGQKDVSIYAVCPSGSALKFDGVNDLAIVPDSKSLDITGRITVECWIKLLSRDFSQVQMAFGKRGAYLIYPENHIYGGTGNWKAQITGTQGDLYGTTNLEIGRWYHLAMTYDGATIIIYLNGRQENSRSYTGGIGLSNYNLSFGNEQTTMSYALNGILDEVRIWNAVKSQEEINVNMNKPLSGNEPNLAGYWNFDEGQGQIAHDLSANGNNGQLGVTPNIDSSDPNWVGSEVPPVPCTFEGLVERNLNRVMNMKLDALDILDDAMAKEKILQDYMDASVRSGEYGGLRKGDVVKSKQKLQTAIQHETQAEDFVNKSIDSLEDSMDALVGSN